MDSLTPYLIVSRNEARRFDVVQLAGSGFHVLADFYCRREAQAAREAAAWATAALVTLLTRERAR